MTKKRIAALSNIIALENVRNEERKSEAIPGIHPACDKWLVTDGIAAVVLSEKPEGLQEAEELQNVYKLVEQEINRTDKLLAYTATQNKIKEWKALAKLWKQGKDHKTGATPVEITVHTDDGYTLTGYYNPWFLVNVVEAVGPNALIYIGRGGRFSNFPTLFVYPKDWMERDPDTIGFLLPIRM